MIEEKNQTANKQKAELPKIFLILRFVALGLLVVGVTLIVLACTAFATYDDFFGLEPSFGCLVPGVLCVFFAIPCTIIGFLPSINKVAIKTSKYIQESNKEDLTDLMSTGMGIGINATSQAIDENRDEFGNVISTTTGMVVGAAADALRTHKDDLKDMADVSAYASHDAIKSHARAMKEGFKDTMFCKHCGATIDRDSKFWSECGGQQ